MPLAKHLNTLTQSVNTRNRLSHPEDIRREVTSLKTSGQTFSSQLTASSDNAKKNLSSVICHLSSFKAFTLIELLITITIIVLLTTMGLISYRSAGENARNSRREQDLAAIQAGLEMHAFENDWYPNNLNDLVTGDFVDPLPSDPQGNNYSYNVYCGTSGTLSCGGSYSCPASGPGTRCCAYELSAPDAEGGETFEICDTL